MLAEQSLALPRRRDRRVRAGVLELVGDWHLEHRPAPRSQHAVDLRQRARVVRDVLEHVIREHHVEGGVGVGQAREIDAAHVVRECV